MLYWMYCVFFLKTIMENKNNTIDQNSQTAGESTERQPVPITGKPKVNPWMLSTFFLGLLLLIFTGSKIFNKRTDEPRVFPIIPSAEPTSSIIKTLKFTGTVQTGKQITEKEVFCSDGLYLVADEGTYLADQTNILLLHLSNEADGTPVPIDTEYIGKRVEVIGNYPGQENYCMANICGCEPYILVESIKTIETNSTVNQKTVEGEIVCLPHRNKSGGQTLECAMGLLGDDGNYYSLEILDQQDLIAGIEGTGKKIIVTGIFKPDPNNKYDIIGTLRNISIEYP